MGGLIHNAAEEHLVLWAGWRYRPRDEDRIWDWWGIFQESRLPGSQFECFAAVANGNLQGLMALDIGGKQGTTGKSIIVDYLATSPANRTADHGLKCVGIGLMAAALARSIEHGCGGRIWLESLPGAAGFYDGLGMARQPNLSAEGRLVYTLETATAEQLLDEIKRKGIVRL